MSDDAAQDREAAALAGASSLRGLQSYLHQVQRECGNGSRLGGCIAALDALLLGCRVVQVPAQPIRVQAFASCTMSLPHAGCAAFTRCSSSISSRPCYQQQLLLSRPASDVTQLFCDAEPQSFHQISAVVEMLRMHSCQFAWGPASHLPTYTWHCPVQVGSCADCTPQHAMIPALLTWDWALSTS